MYCKHCGKTIADDSSFCQFCGQSQGEEKINVSSDESQPNPKIGIGLTIVRFIKRHTTILIIYGIWFMVHLALLGAGDNYSGFCPHKTHYGHLKWDVDYYGFPEFVVYVFLIPLVLFALIKLIKSPSFKKFIKYLRE